VDAFLDGGEAAAIDRRLRAANDAFHQGIRGLAGNDRLGSTVRDLEGFFPKDHVWRAAVEVGELEALNRDDHDAVLEAIAARRSGPARRAMTAHVGHAGRILIGFLDDQGFWS